MILKANWYHSCRGFPRKAGRDVLPAIGQIFLHLLYMGEI